MFCLICNRLTQSKVTLLDLFRTSKYNICQYCYIQSFMIFEHFVIPIENYILDVKILFDKINEHHPMAYYIFLSPYLMNMIKNHRNEILMIFDEYSEEIYEMVDLLNLGNIYIIALYEKQKED